MEASGTLNSLLEAGLYLLWLIPVFGVYSYFRIFIDRYSIALKNTQRGFNIRMITESDNRRTRANLEQMSKDLDISIEEEEEVDVRAMSPSERILYCLEKGLILNLKIPVSEVQIGQVLGLDAITSSGDVLLARGSYITNGALQQLHKLGISEVSIMFHPDHPRAKKMAS